MFVGEQLLFAVADSHSRVTGHNASMVWCGVSWYCMVWVGVVWWVCVPCYVFYGGVMHMVAVSWSACLPPLSPLVMGAAGD